MRETLSFALEKMMRGRASPLAYRRITDYLQM